MIETTIEQWVAMLGLVGLLLLDDKYKLSSKLLKLRGKWIL